MAMKKVVALMGFMHRTLETDEAPSELIEREKGEEFEIEDKDPQYRSFKHSSRIADAKKAEPAKK